MSATVETISFKSNRGRQVQRKERRQKNLSHKYPIRAARLLALAHDIQHRIDTGEFHDYADVARHHNLTRARLTQIMNLLLLAPDIQDEILHMESEVGREPISARDLRRVLVSLEWGEQRRVWLTLQSAHSRQDS
ncbi:MAG: hypothetical protein JXR76_29145 [Deltaproteobacteria bacterium]|nr:hypothetical protein [Deltaproteobacteria bacterium]